MTKPLTGPRAPLPDLVRVSDLAKETPWLTEASLRDLIYHAEPRISASGEQIPANGFAPCIVRVGGILIDRDAFRQFIEAHRGAPSKKRST